MNADTERPAKACTCCALAYSAESWAALAYVGVMRVPADDEGPAVDLEMRNCACQSTLAIEVPS